MLYLNPQKKVSISTCSPTFFSKRQAPSTFFQPVIQPKLEINRPGNKYEQEADAMANRVMLMPEGQGLTAPAIQRKCTQCEEEEKGNTTPLMRKAAHDDDLQAPQHLEATLAGTKGTGTPLPADTKSFMENAFHADLSHIRIHDNPASTAMSKTIQAKAFTHGSDIYFNSGQYNPHSPEGKHLLAHELTHTQQQGKAGTSLQRQPADAAVYTSAVPANIPLEKRGEHVEQAYRQAGLVTAADAVRDCRESGRCDKLLTESEAYNMYRSGRQIAGLGEPETQKGEKTGIPIATGSLEGAAGKKITEPTVKTAFIPAALVPALAPTLAPAAIPTAVAPTAVPAAAGASIATVAIPVAMGIYVAVAIYSLISYGAFQNELAAQGYFILPSPLQVCIGNCHQPKAQQPSPWLLNPVDPLFGQPLKPLPWPQSLPQPWPESWPQSWPKEEDKRKNKCTSNWVAPKFGRYPCHSDFAKLFNGTRLEYQVTAPPGLTADFDSVRGDVLIEVKTGYQWLLNKHLSPKMEARKKQVINRFQEQSFQQFLIAEACNYKLEWYFNSKAVAEAMQKELPHIEVKWRPYDCDKDSDHTW